MATIFIKLKITKMQNKKLQKSPEIKNVEKH